MKGANLRARVNITFEEAVFGCDKELEIVLKDECTTCHGTGAKPGTQPTTCPKCHGEGQIVYTQQSMFGWFEMYRPVRTVMEPERSSKKNVLLAAAQVIHLQERRFRSPFRQVLTMDRAFVSVTKVSREPMVDQEVICL